MKPETKLESGTLEPERNWNPQHWSPEHNWNPQNWSPEHNWNPQNWSPEQYWNPQNWSPEQNRNGFLKAERQLAVFLTQACQSHKLICGDFPKIQSRPNPQSVRVHEK
ncbi:hypothetical protein TNCT_667601 [Trichonephila clavata]|uniref:Uncharacterized protein n=1 Tax=Trichonephila clavata TaxID=2740835 RepID=A0A8X6KF84_TRICU|nr:hypothetical protein TNCT_667601 [Trichonephila clavata]